MDRRRLSHRFKHGHFSRSRRLPRIKEFLPKDELDSTTASPTLQNCLFLAKKAPRRRAHHVPHLPNRGALHLPFLQGADLRHIQPHSAPHAYRQCPAADRHHPAADFLTADHRGRPHTLFRTYRDTILLADLLDDRTLHRDECALDECAVSLTNLPNGLSDFVSDDSEPLERTIDSEPPLCAHERSTDERTTDILSDVLTGDSEPLERTTDVPEPLCCAYERTSDVLSDDPEPLERRADRSADFGRRFSVPAGFAESREL